MKFILIVFLLILGGCATIIPVKSYPTSIPLPVCREGQTDNCRKLSAGDLGGTTRGYYDDETE